MSLDKQRENQIKQQEEATRKKQEMRDLLAPVRVQNTYNKENLETQHKYNLEIFEKQANLTREMQHKQSILTKRSTVITAVCSIIASIIGAIVGGLIVFLLNKPHQQTQLKTQTQINQDTSVPKKDQSLSLETKTKQSE
jgi:uncharacterized protein YdhG (YjbR/CyaY superfamily)